jgi:MFS family permease
VRFFCYIAYAVGINYWWLVAGAIFEGLSRSFYSGNNDAFLYDTLADNGLESEYGDYLGKVSSTEQLALGISALIGGIIASFSFTYLVWLAVLVQIGVLLVSYKFIEPKSRKKLDSNPFADIKSAVMMFVKNKKLRLLSIASVIDFSFSEMMYQFRATFIGMVWPIWAIGLANVLSNFGATASFYFSGRILKRFKAINLLLFQTIWGKTIGLISYGFPSIFSPLLMSTGSLLFGVGMVAENKLMQAEFTDHQRATMQSLNSLAGSIGFAIMSVILGSLADAMTPAKALLALNIVSIPIIYLYWALFNHDKKLDTSNTY